MKERYIVINGRRISVNDEPYIIAEMSANHGGNIGTAFKILEEAKEAGADAVKLQTYTADTITLDCNNEEFKISGGLWDGRTLYDLYEEAHLPWDWHKPLFQHANKLGMTIFSSPFDNTAVDLLEDLNAPAYKIASFEAVDLPLIKYVAGTGKPVIISTGMANLQEIEEAIQAARDGGCTQLAILHCVSGYPALPQDYNLKTIPDLISRFGLPTGLSDHTLDNTTAIASVANGASLIEKHFTLNRNGGGPDDSFSLEPEDLRALCVDSKTAWQSQGKIDYAQKSSETGNIKLRRSLYCVRDIKSGEVLTSKNIRSVRPGYGLKPKFYEEVIGQYATKDIPSCTPLNWDLFVKG